jgi:hypothetical protein
VTKTFDCQCGARLEADDDDALLAALSDHAASQHAEDPMYSQMELSAMLTRSANQPASGIDPLIADLRTFILSYGDHDSECPGRDAMGPEAVSGATCRCGFIGRMNTLLAEVAARMDNPPVIDAD